MSAPPPDIAPPQFTPLRFRVGRPWVAVALYIVLYGLLAVAFYVAVVGPAAPLTLGNVLKMAGISGDALAVALLALTQMVEGYSKEAYIAAYLDRARREFPAAWTDDQVKLQLGVWHTKLRARTSRILKVSVGAAIAALGVLLAFLGDFA